MAIDRSKFLLRFKEEAQDHCAKLNDGLLYLESTLSSAAGTESENISHAGFDSETINSLFRSAHTIKGSAKMMKLSSIGELAHSMEELLDSVRSGKINLNSQFFHLLFKGVDALLSMTESVTSPDGVPPAPAELCASLKKAASSDNSSDNAQTVENLDAEQPLENVETTSESIETTSKSLKSTSESIENTSKAVEHTPETMAVEAKKGKAQYLHINTTKLDDLIHLMGEIISDHNRFKQDTKMLQENSRSVRQSISSLASLVDNNDFNIETIRQKVEEGMAAQLSLQNLVKNISDSLLMYSHLIGELQDTTLKLSMMPLSTVFEPLRRAVRDLAKEAGKEVQFVVTGGETELDRKIAEQIGDSLLHMLRNSIDHGIETPEERAAAGKPSKGTICLSAFYDSGGVTIALKDDGKGIDSEKIRAKALAKRLFSPEAFETMSRTEILNLIFLPGFSTSPIITDLSGRGVGMDVVRKNIVDELKGTIFMDTEQGQGTSFMLSLPLNLAVFPLCMVSADNQTFALPATSIAELCSVSFDEIIEIVGKNAIRLREELIPVEYLSKILKLKQQTQTSKVKQVKSSVSIVIVKDGANKLGVIVDNIIGREEMVVKPLPAHIVNLEIVTGGTIGTGGSIINVLSVPELVRLSSRHSDYKSMLDRSASYKQDSADLAAKISESCILVVDDSINTREIEKSILEAYGYTVETADDGQYALDMTKEKLYDLVVTDVEMPRLSGFGLTEQLRADPRYRSVPIVIVTSLDKESDRKRGIMVGADAYIVKRAFDQSKLLDTVKSLIG